MSPLVDGGAEGSSTNIDGPDLNGNFQFNIQVGAGTHYFLSERTAPTVQYRWLHFSNAGIERPNHGTNTQMFHVGVAGFSDSGYSPSNGILSFPDPSQS